MEEEEMKLVKDKSAELLRTISPIIDQISLLWLRKEHYLNSGHTQTVSDVDWVERTREEETFSITPKGLIFYSLGGYKNQESTKPLTEEVVKHLVDFCSRNEFAIVVIDGKLEFVKFKLINDEQ